MRQDQADAREVSPGAGATRGQQEWRGVNAVRRSTRTPQARDDQLLSEGGTLIFTSKISDSRRRKLVDVEVRKVLGPRNNSASIVETQGAKGVE